MQGIILIDVTRCLGCKTCEIECAVAHSRSGHLLGAIQEYPSPRSRVDLEEMDGMSVPIQCRHCEAAPCVAICPTRAISKRGLEGPVVIDESLCVGCQFCIAVCPYGVPQLKGDGRIITKCDLCFERLEKGQEPACASGCPTGALTYRTISELNREVRRQARMRPIARRER